jgi:hypothetical protein
MRLILAAALGLAAGCVGTPSPPPDGPVGPPPHAGPTGDDVVRLSVAVVERPLGDRCLDDELWKLADEQQVTPPEGPDVELKWKRLLTENGLRVGVLGGLLPDRLHRLVDGARSGSAPRQAHFHAGQPWPVALGPAWPRCCFTARLPDGDRDIDLEQAQGELRLTATLRGPEVSLLCTPAVRHGAPSLAPRPVQGPDGTLRWDMQAEQPREELAGLSWRLKLAPDEVALIGGRLDRPGTFGHRCFVQEDGATPVQRLLVLRVARDGGAPVSDAALRRSLALQAGLTAARGSAP